VTAKHFITVILFLAPIPLSFGQQNEIFTDITTNSGIDFKYSFGDTSYENILESSGSGVTIFDYNGDGFYDVYLLNGTYLDGISDITSKAMNPTNQLFHNNGDGTFTEVTSASGLGSLNWSMTASPIDIDMDGDMDLYIANYGPNQFYINNGGIFVDKAEEMNITGPVTLNKFTKWSVSVAFLDFNKDDKIDLFMGNFLAYDPDYKSYPNPELMPHPAEYNGQPSLLYIQENDGSFSDISEKTDLYYPDSKCMGITVFDYDDDGDMDILQCNDHQPNFLFRNDGSSYTEVGAISGIAVNSQGLPTGSMHGSIGDIDGDNMVDILVTDLKYGSLYRQVASGIFEDITESSGIASIFQGKGVWASILFDYDNDGDLDIFSANGTAEELILQPPLLLENDGYGNFKRIKNQAGGYFSELHSGRGASVFDFDNDGDLDIIVSHIEPGSRATLLQNNSTKNHWLGINLNASNPIHLIGSKLILETQEKKLVRIYQPSMSYLSFSDPRILFGLGSESKVTRLSIIWANGDMENFENPEIDNYLTIIKGKGIQ